LRICSIGPTSLGPKKHHSGPLEQQITASKKLTLPGQKKYKCLVIVFIVQVHLPVDGVTICLINEITHAWSWD